MSTPGGLGVSRESYIADVAISQYAVVVCGTTEGHCKLPASARVSKILGVAQEASTASGDVIEIVTRGRSKVIASAATVIGTPAAINDSVGRAYGPAGFASGDGVLGYWRETASASGDIVVVDVMPHELTR